MSRIWIWLQLLCQKHLLELSTVSISIVAQMIFKGLNIKICNVIIQHYFIHINISVKHYLAFTPNAPRNTEHHVYLYRPHMKRVRHAYSLTFSGYFLGFSHHKTSARCACGAARVCIRIVLLCVCFMRAEIIVAPRAHDIKACNIAALPNQPRTSRIRRAFCSHKYIRQTCVCICLFVCMGLCARVATAYNGHTKRALHSNVHNTHTHIPFHYKQRRKIRVKFRPSPSPSSRVLFIMHGDMDALGVRITRRIRLSGQK